MLQADSEVRPDTDLIAEIVTPLYVATALFALLALSFVLGSEHEPGWPTFLFPGILLFSALTAREACQRGWVRLAGLLIAATVSLLPIATLFTIGFVDNPFMFIAPLGVMIGMVTVSPRVGLILMGLGLALTGAAVVLSSAGVLLTPAILGLLLLAAAAFGG